VYGLGAILYELLTGHPPFEGSSSAETAYLARTLEPVPPRRLRPLVPADLEAVCLRCLEKDPRRRYARAGDLADDLAGFLAGRRRRFGLLTRLLRRRQPGASAGLFLALAGLAALGWGLAIHFWLRTR
jgi:serine/threonine-protein kinase